ncbi:hypothetical protein HHI36_012661 [Cryptolaemus montrouzieri]|uniref:YqaJ viral recombinase domain-containing protein n=1 Tax=Cryptolaemus montrouzieri TaxID=559131 RepID=A0ABD2NG02_9CUCU
MLSEENMLKFKSNLGKLQNAVGFTWLLRSDQAYSEIVADVESIVFPQEFLEYLQLWVSESYTLDGVKAIQWGRDHEKDGIRVLEENRKVHVTPTGLWLDQCGFIGGSPDGLVNDDGIVEVKCPYKLRS